MDKDYLKRINSFTCPIPQYNEMGRKWGNWVVRNTPKNPKNTSKKEGK